MSARTLISAVATAWLSLACCNAWGYGWVGHWRVMESTWDSVSAKVCPNSAPLPPFNKLSRSEAGAAALGAVFSDIGYLPPPAPRQFSDLLHYIGAGQFTDNLTAVVCERHSRDRAMLAFAAGFRTHYWADRHGHHEGTNKSAAKISPKGSPYLGRMVYEEDPATHRRLEIVAHSVFDFKNGPALAADAFIGTAGSFSETIVGVVREAVLRTYEGAGLQLAPDYAQILRASWSIMQTVCATVHRVYAGGPKDASTKKIADSCIDQLNRKDLPGDTAPPGGFLNFVDDGFKYSLDKLVEQNYEESIVHVETVLNSSPSGPLQNINLDTNQPSIGGQYESADRTFALLVKNPPAVKCDSGAFRDIAYGRKSSWKDYQKAAVCADTIVRKPVTEAHCGHLFTDDDLSAIVSGWLADIRPKFPSTNIPAQCVPGNSGGKRPTFTLDANCKVSSTEPLSPVEMLYGCSIGSLTSTEIENWRFEAVRRLRIGQPIDSSTGLYKPKPRP